ncbi:MAG: HEAT repeat domain-containing protein [Thermogemmata sp.]
MLWQRLVLAGGWIVAVAALLAAQEGTQNPPPMQEFKWPTNIAGKGVQEWLKEVDDPDPGKREMALNTLPSFGPDAIKICSRKIVERMRNEKDPSVRMAAYRAAVMLGLDDRDWKDAITILANAVDQGVPGSQTRLAAVQALAAIGPRAESAVSVLTGVVCQDPSYAIRQAVANALGRVGGNEIYGPNVRALNRLAGTLASDVAAAVRLEALQSLVLLGPPWTGRRNNSKDPPPIDWKQAAYVADRMRERLQGPKGKSGELDPQIEIWVRVVLMRFDPKEIGDTHLNAIAKHLSSSELGPRLQALQALSLFAEQAAGGKRLDAVVQLLPPDSLTDLNTINPIELNLVLGCLVAMGREAQGVLPTLEKLEKTFEKLRDKRMQEEDFKQALKNLGPKQTREQLIAALPEEQLRLAVAQAIKYIRKPELRFSEVPKGKTP